MLLPTLRTLKPTEQHEHFTRWLRDHGAILHHVAHGFASGDDRQDLMQELLLAMWKAVPAFRGGSLPSTFVYRVAHNTAMTWRRTRRNYFRKVEQYEMLMPAVNAMSQPDLTTALLDEVYAAIRELPPLDRSLMLLSLDGVSYQQMAVIHGISESNVGVRLSRARQDLTLTLKGTHHES